MYKKTIDHLGNEFKSEAEMCRYYKIAKSTYTSRIKHGWTLKEALTKKANDNLTCMDHLGNSFNTQKAMCDYYNIDPTLFVKRMAKGWSLEKVLTTPVKKRAKSIVSTDHLGNKYPSQRAMCIHYEISTQTFTYRIAHGMSIKEALTKK